MKVLSVTPLPLSAALPGGDVFERNTLSVFLLEDKEEREKQMLVNQQRECLEWKGEERRGKEKRRKGE